MNTNRQTDRQTDRDGQTDRDRQTGAYSAVLPVGFPSPCPASETPSALAPPRLSPMVVLQPKGEREREEEEIRRGEGGKDREGVKEGKGRRKNG